MNYTPINEKLLHNTSRSNKSSQVLFSVVSFFTAVALSGSVYLSYSNSKQQTTTTKASEVVSESCKPGVLHNPQTITALASETIPVKKNETVKTDTITFTWDSVPGAKSYYVLLNGDKGVPVPKQDPILSGIEVTEPTYTIKDLQPNTTYYLYIRSKNAENKYGVTFLNKADCKSATPVASVFNFSTAP